MKKLFMKKRNIKPVRTADFVLGGIVIVAAVIGFIYILYPKQDDLYVSVSQNGKTVYEHRLNEESTPINYTIDGDIKVVLLIEKDGVTVLSSECPDKLCQKTGKLKKAGQAVVCLPAKVSVKLKGVAYNSELDGVAG